MVKTALREDSAKSSRSLLEHDLVEAVDLVGGADAERGALVDARDLDVEHRAAGDAVGGLAAW